MVLINIAGGDSYEGVITDIGGDSCDGVGGDSWMVLVAIDSVMQTVWLEWY